MVYAEGGRRPGKRPPPGALNLWVERVLGAGRIAGKGANASRTARGRGSRRMKGNAREQAIKSAAFLVGRAIGKRGIKPRPFLRPAAEAIAPHLPAVMQKMFAQAVDIAELRAFTKQQLG